MAFKHGGKIADRGHAHYKQARTTTSLTRLLERERDPTWQYLARSKASYTVDGVRFREVYVLSGVWTPRSESWSGIDRTWSRVHQPRRSRVHALAAQVAAVPGLIGLREHGWVTI